MKNSVEKKRRKKTPKQMIAQNKWYANKLNVISGLQSSSLGH